MHWSRHRSRLLGLRRLRWNLLAMGSVPGPVGLRLLLNQRRVRILVCAAHYVITLVDGVGAARFRRLVATQQRSLRADSVEKVPSLKSLQICQNAIDILMDATAADRFRTRSVQSEGEDEGPRVRIWKPHPQR